MVFQNLFVHPACKGHKAKKKKKANAGSSIGTACALSKYVMYKTEIHNHISIILELFRWKKN